MNKNDFKVQIEKKDDTKNNQSVLKNKALSEYLLEIIKPVYPLPREQKLNQYGEKNIWIPSLNIRNSELVEKEIELLKSLKPVY